MAHGRTNVVVVKKNEKTEPVSYYYFASVKLLPGSVVAPGNWGRMLRRYENASATGNSFGSAWIVARELRFEVIRLKHFAEKPSRLESAFCCPSLEDARSYQASAGVDAARVLLLHR